jgi:transcriptional regulator GlxA family with amidase domain
VPPIVGPIAETVAANPQIVTRLQDRADHEVIASVCTGAFFLAEAGLLSGGRATTNPAYAEAFRGRYADVDLVPGERLIDRGNVLCAGSTTAFLDLGIYLIDRFASHELAVLTAKSLCIDLSRRSQLPYFVYVAPKDHGDAAVLALQLWLEQHHHRALSMGELVGAAPFRPSAAWRPPRRSRP